MKKTVFCLLSMAFLLGSCLKKDTGCGYSDNNIVAPVSEQQVIEEYLSNNSLSATKHSSGLYYSIVTSGTNSSPALCSTILIDYSGKLANGNQFDAGTGVVFTLGSLIEGWKKGIPLIGKGGQIKLYIPPSLGYGSGDYKDGYGNVVIPGNSMLIFDVTLTDFN